MWHVWIGFWLHIWIVDFRFLLQRVPSVVISLFTSVRCLIGCRCIRVMRLVTLGRTNILLQRYNGMRELWLFKRQSTIVDSRINQRLVYIIWSYDYIRVFHYEAISLAHIQLNERLLLLLIPGLHAGTSYNIKCSPNLFIRLWRSDVFHIIIFN